MGYRVRCSNETTPRDTIQHSTTPVKMSADKAEIAAYREEQIHHAIALFEENKHMSMRRAAMLCRVPPSTVTHQYNGRLTRSEGHSKQQLLSEAEEKALESCYGHAT